MYLCQDLSEEEKSFQDCDMGKWTDSNAMYKIKIDILVHI